MPGRLEPGDAPCGQTGQHYNPFRVDANSSPPAGQGSTDQYEVGDLSGKYGNLANRQQVAGSFVDPSLTLFGRLSVVGRSVVIHKSPVPHQWVCANIEPEREQGLLTAVATFTYPVGGRVVFRQEKDAPLSDTMVYVEGLLYTDGSKERTDSHAWHVHMQVPGKDFFNWTGCCKSAGEQFNPYRVSREEGIYLCTRADGQVGDLSGEYGNLDELKSVKEVHNDTSLPMYGLASIIGRSVVLHRREGERWACSSIGWGWDPDEASQVTAIASFHHPNGFAWGYIRFSQVVYNDGSSTDTIIQVRLKHPGKTNREQTFGHDWELEELQALLALLLHLLLLYHLLPLLLQVHTLQLMVEQQHRVVEELKSQLARSNSALQPRVPASPAGQEPRPGARAATPRPLPVPAPTRPGQASAQVPSPALEINININVDYVRY